jgi:Tol biopolymer transport system component
MPPLLPVTSCPAPLRLALALALAGPALAQHHQPSLPQIPTLPSIKLSASGSTGESALAILQQDLDTMGIPASTRPQGGNASSPAPWLVELSSVGGHIEAQMFRDGQPVFEQLYEDAALELNAHDLADSIYRTVTGRGGITSAPIVYSAGAGSSRAIYLTDLSGKDHTRLTPPEVYAVSPSISNDSTLLIYTAYSRSDANIEMLSLISGERNTLLELPGTPGGASLSPSSDQLSVSISLFGNPELYVFGLGGEPPRRLTRGRGAAGDASWSPDGSRLAYVDASPDALPQILVTLVDRPSPQPLTPPEIAATQPSWSPDGRHLAFTCWAADGSSGLAIADLKDASWQPITIVGPGASSPAWGATGEHLVFVQDGQLMILDFRKSTATPIPTPRVIGPIAEPHWSW